MQRIVLALPLLLTLGACAAPVANQAFQDIAAQTEQQIGQRPVWIRSEADEQAARATLDRLLAKPLSADDAVQIALLNNRRLQAGLAELGIGAADLTASWRPPNPGIGFSRTQRSGEVEIERSFSIDALSLLALPLRAGIEARQFERTKLQTAGEILGLAAQTKRAWYEAVAAEQTARYIQTMRESASVQAELARRMYQAGNWSMLDYAREQLFYADATARLARSRLSATAAREKLARLMGLWGDDLRFTLPERLPVLPGTPRDAGNIEADAIGRRLDIKLAQAELEAVRKAHGLTSALRFVNVLETGFVRKSEEGRSDRVGYEIRLEVPIFDFGDAKATKAEQVWRQAVNRLTDTAVDARSSAREAWLAYRTAYDLAQHYQNEILPLRQKIGEEMVLRYNGMLVSVFDLLADAREQISEVTAALEAQRDFWIADTDLTFVTLAATRSGS
ncbi:MAG: TolC family protein [Ferrovibrio sp.]|jgi:outer membrane protein TolC|uniref:TolC family protein n=1 Tax=Ferrovibrio sp. TaxID=1917215 RepID=UPI003919E4AB